VADKRTRRRKKKTVFDGGAVTFNTSSSPLQVFKNIVNARWRLPAGISTLLLMVYVFIYSSDFLILLNPLNALESLTFTSSGGGTDDVRNDEIEAFKANLGIGIYVFVLLYSVFFLKTIVKTLIAHPHILLIIAVLLYGTTVSVNPQQVFFSTVQVGIGILIAIVYAIQHSSAEGWDRRFCLTILFPVFLVHLYSLVLFFANGLSVIEFLEGSARFGGLPGNPNVAGASAVLGVWSSLYVILGGGNSRAIKIYCSLALCLFAFTIVMSGSATSITVSIAVVAMMIWLKFLTLFRSALKRVAYIGFGGLVMFTLVGVILVNDATEELTETFTSSLGKQTDLTGRTELWDIAAAAIEERPFLGWSVDQHETVQENRKYVIPQDLGHFHNGFLDTAVAGGLVLLALVLWNMVGYVRNCFKTRVNTRFVYGFVGPVVILVLMNLSEYSLLRPLSVLFEFYLCAYFLLVMSRLAAEESGAPVAMAPDARPVKVKSDRKRTSKGGVRYRF